MRITRPWIAGALALALVVGAAPAVLAADRASATAAPVASALPIGDGKVSTDGPQVGWVYACSIVTGGGGAFRDGPWIDAATGTWDPSQKIAVQGSVTWDGSITIATTDSARTIVSNDLPSHPSGIFPIESADPAYAYDRNPNTITAHAIDLTLPVAPEVAAEPGCVSLGPVGVMLTGPVLFDALDAEGRDAAAHETLDACDGHPERTGAYHYHSLSGCAGVDAAGDTVLVGWALDGFPIVAGAIDGHDATNADLDTCHGSTVSVDIDGTSTTTYAYHMTAEYPYSVGCWTGTPVVTFG